MAITAQELAKIMPPATDLLSDEPEMESSLHALQLRLLVNILEWHWRNRNDFFIGDNLTVFFSRQQLKTHDFRGPDFFLVTGTERRHRTSWVVWEEGKFPNLIIELLSDSTAEIDRDLKKKIYEQRFQTPEYFWFSPITEEFAGFRLYGTSYREIKPNEHGWLWSEVLKLYLGVHNRLLRYFTPDGELVASPNEAAEQAIEAAEQEARHAKQETWRAEQANRVAQQERERAEREKQRAEQEKQRAEQFAAKLRELGIDPNSI